MCFDSLEKVIFNFWLKSNNLQNVLTKKEMWHELAIGQVCPLYEQNDQSSSHRLSALCLCNREHNQTSWKECIARNGNGVLKSEMELLYPRWPLPAAVIAGYSRFSCRSNFGYYRFRLFEYFVKTYLDCRKQLFQSLSS